MNSQDALLVEGFLNHIEGNYVLTDIEDIDTSQSMYTIIGDDIDTIRASIENIIDNNLGTTEEIDAVLEHCDNSDAPTTTLCSILAQTDLGMPLNIAANIETNEELFKDVTNEEKQEAVNEAFGREIDIEKYRDYPMAFVAGGFAEESNYINDYKYDFPTSSSGEAIVTENGYIMDYMTYDMREAPQELVDIVVEMHPVHTYQIDAVVDGYEKGLTADEIKIYADSGLHSSVMEAVKDAIVEAKEGYSVASDINDIKEKVEAYKEAISEIFTDENGNFDGERYYDASFSFEDAITGDALDEKLDAVLFRAENNDRLDYIERNSDNESLDYRNDLFKEVYEELKDDEDKDTKLDIATGLTTFCTHQEDDVVEDDTKEVLSLVEQAVEIKDDIDKELGIELDPAEAGGIATFNISEEGMAEIKECITDWKDDEDRIGKIFSVGDIVESIENGEMTKEDVDGDVKSFVDEHNDDIKVISGLIDEAPVFCEIVKDEDLTSKIKDLMNKDPDGFKQDIDLFLRAGKDSGHDTVADKIETISTRVEVYPKEEAIKELVANDVNIGELSASDENVMEVIDEIREMITDEDGDIDPDKVEEFNKEHGADWVNEQIKDISENDLLIEGINIDADIDEEKIAQDIEDTSNDISDSIKDFESKEDESGADSKVDKDEGSDNHDCADDDETDDKADKDDSDNCDFTDDDEE